MTTQIRLTQPHGRHAWASSYNPAVTYLPGDVVTNVFETAPRQWRRYVGDITDSDTLTFTVSWRGTTDRARYCHGHEPSTLRAATTADVDSASNHDQRRAASDELRRIARAHPQWPAEIRRALTARANQLTERPTS